MVASFNRFRPRRKKYKEDYNKRAHKAQIDKALPEYYARQEEQPVQQTTAERIAERMGNDCTVWELPDGTTLDRLIFEADAESEDFACGTATRHTFADGSVIIETLHKWFVVKRNLDQYSLPFLKKE